jgi:iron(III) transport system permease protein
MSGPRQRLPGLAALPMTLLLGAASAPLLFLLAGLAMSAPRLELTSLARTLGFAVGGGLVSTVVGLAAGSILGTRDFRGRMGLIALSCVLVAAPPAFWWIGLTRLTVLPWGNLAGPWSAALVAGLALSPLTLLLVLAALRELPSNLYEAARVALSPGRRFGFVLVPLLRSPLVAGFLLTVIVLLGESELPFLFGFRTVMTDVVTAFSQTFDVKMVVPLVVPLLLIVLVLGGLAGGPLLRTVLASSRGAHGVIRRPGRSVAAIAAFLPGALAVMSLAGYAWAAGSGLGRGGPRIATDPRTVIVSIVEPVACSWATVALVVAAAYPVRGARVMRPFLWAGLLLFCVPAAIFAIGWIGLGQALGSVTMRPDLAYVCRSVGLPALGLAVAYARLPQSLEDAARLVPVSGLRRAFHLVLPLLAPSLAASAALLAALTYADRDVASMLLEPGSSRLMLDLYLVSANAPAATVGALALVAFAGAGVTVTLAAAGPLLVWRRRG